MSKAVPKQEFLAELQARVSHNRQIVETVFMPLDQDERSWQPEPGEWSVDQCFQHLILSFESYLPIVAESLQKPESPNSYGLFRQSWWARRLKGKLWDPQKKFPTKKKFFPAEVYYPDVFPRFLKQLDHLSAMIEQAAHADLQDTSWFHKEVLIRFNLGDHLNSFVSHDELHMDQARRVLEAYAERVEAVIA